VSAGTAAFLGFRAGAGVSPAPALGVRWVAAYGAGVAAGRPSRSLSESQAAALDRLRRAGAPSLDADFTPDELRRAYRHLAKTHHPDRFQNLTAEAQERLASAFAELTDAYRLLQTCQTTRQ
jgi:hypothetical protein